MATDSERGFLEAVTTALEPYLSSEARKVGPALRAIFDLFPGKSLAEIKKTVQSLQAILALFPGRTPAEVEKTVRSLQASAQKDVSALVSRARAMVEGGAAESVSDLMQAVSKLNVAELKELGTNLGLALSGGKAKLAADIQAWLASGGTYRPAAAAVKPRKKTVEELAAGLPRVSGNMPKETADQIIAGAEEAASALTVAEFERFASAIGIAALGGKTKVAKLQSLKDYVNRLAVSHGQTQF